MSLDNPTALLNNDSKRIQAKSFLPLTLRHISLDEVVKITWKDVVKYLFY